MKELTIEEKAKAYDDAIENARYYHSEMEGDICCILEDCFPELRESKESAGWEDSIIESLYNDLKKLTEQ